MTAATLTLQKFNVPLLRNVIRYYFEETPTGLVHMKKQELMERIHWLFMDLPEPSTETEAMAPAMTDCKCLLPASIHFLCIN